MFYLTLMLLEERELRVIVYVLPPQTQTASLLTAQGETDSLCVYLLLYGTTFMFQTILHTIVTPLQRLVQSPIQSHSLKENKNKSHITVSVQHANEKSVHF